ncbi:MULTISPECIES: translocation/assembly module TamB domain-containing protein [unclassified Microbulbifer]|uniref:translocation/assembly module TamB domain-containing protein n=1 Tax=unclassified Microbulbifer TaxID=2619833 RepID=UPI0027E468F5|nr:MULTISPECIES: translocation/assembly module TamB domain-containing protein [unclassified Microbulbifer]
MWGALTAYLSAVVRALGSVAHSLWHGLGERRSLLFSLLLALPLALLLLLGTEGGRVLLTHGTLYVAEKLVPELRIEAGEIGSEHLGGWTFSRLKIHYGPEVLLEGRGLEVDVSLGGLIGNRIDIEKIGAEELIFNDDVLEELLEAQRQAVRDAVEPPEEKAFSPPAVRLGSLQIDRLQVIDRRLAGLPAVSVRSSGRYLWEGEPAGIQLEVRELNGAGLQLILEGREVENRRYVLEFSAKENPGGFVGTLLQLPQGQALDAEGHLALWQPGDDQLLLHIESFSLPLVQHRFSLSGRAALTLSPWKLATEGLQLRVDDSRHHIAGTVSGETVDAEIQFNRLPLAISRPWQDVLDGGYLSADLKIKGPLKLPAVSGTLDLDSRYSGQPLRLQGLVQTRDKIIVIDTATVTLADAQLAAQGSVDIAGESLDLKGEIHRLALDSIRELLAALPQTGEVEIPSDLGGSVERLQLSAKGPWKNPALTVQLDAALVYRQLDAQLRAGVRGDLNRVTLSEILLDSERLRIDGDGTVDIAGESLDLNLKVNAEDFRPAEQLGLAAAEGVAMDMTAEVDVAGPWKNPQASARIRSDGSYRDYRYQLRGGAAGDLDKIDLNRLRLDLFADSGARRFSAQPLRGPQSLISERSQSDISSSPQQSRVATLAADAERLSRDGNAWLEVDGIIEPRAARARGRMAGRNIPVSLAELAGVALPPSLEGEISIDGEFSGPFANPEARAEVLGLGAFRSEPWQLQGDLAYGGGRVALSEVELVWAERNQLSAHGSLDRQRLDLEVRGRAVLADFDEWLAADITERGEVTLSATAAGSPQQPQLEGEFKLLSQSRGRGESVQPLELVFDWHTEGENLQMTLDARHGARRAIDARARLAVAPILEQLFADTPPGAQKPPLPLKLDSSGSADLAVVAAFIDPEIHAMSGQLRFELNADGTSERPKLRGYVDLENGSYEHRPTSTRLRRIDFAARLTPEAWRIERARAEDTEKGSVSLAGAVRFAEGVPPVLDFRLRADRAHLLNTPAVRGAISGELTLTGDTGDAQLGGVLTLRPLEVQIEQLIGSSVPEIEVVEVDLDLDLEGSQPERVPPLLQNIALAIQVVLDQQSYVRGLGLDSELRGKVDIAGTAAKPRAAGELRIVRGSFDLLGKRFELQEGQVQFENNEAAIYVKGVHEYSDGEITAEITGTTRDLDVTFSSSPAAPQDEIFAQLLFGKSLSDISPLQAVRLVSVVRTLQSGGPTFDPLAKTRDLLGVDTLDIQQEEAAEGEQDQYALSLGKYITNRIYIELQRSTDPLNPWQAEMEIELKRNLSLEIKSAAEGESGAGSVELQWKKDY